jgi:hypothetical protein
LAFFNTQRFLEILNLSLISFFSINSYLFSTSNRNPDFLNQKGSNFLKKGYTFFNNNYDFQIILIPPKFFPTETFKCLNASMIGKLILFNGTCLTNKSIITRLKLATYFCKNCGLKVSSKINESTFKPVLFCFSKICEKKFNRKLFLDINLSKFQNHQVIKCSDVEEEYVENPKEEMEIFLDEQMNDDFYPGIKIRCAGILLPSAYEWVSSFSGSSNFFFQATFIEKLDYKFNPRNGISFNLQASVGNRKIKQNPRINENAYRNVDLFSAQYQIETFFNSYLPIAKRACLKLGIQAAGIYADNIFKNELFRIGGLKTLRGFDEESIFASTYVIPTIEYRYLFEENSALFLFAEGAWYESTLNNNYVKDTPISFGAGINFETKAGIFSLNYALGKQFSNAVDLRTGKIHFGLINKF